MIAWFPTVKRIFTLSQEKPKKSLRETILTVNALSVLSWYDDLQVQETVFYRKSQAQKQAVLRKFKNQEVRSPDEVLLDIGDNEGAYSNSLPISAQQCGIIRVPYEVLKQMIQKVGVHLARSKEAIVAAPGANAVPEHYVESERGSPYVVKTKRVPNVTSATVNASPMQLTAYALIPSL